ncbi:hypothetical protein [Tsuneonella sp. HG222]
MTEPHFFLLGPYAVDPPYGAPPGYLENLADLHESLMPLGFDLSDPQADE